MEGMGWLWEIFLVCVVKTDCKLSDTGGINLASKETARTDGDAGTLNSDSSTCVMLKPYIYAVSDSTPPMPHLNADRLVGIVSVFDM